MPRLFVAAPIPDPLARVLALSGGGIPGARFVAADSMHITVQFIGDVDGGRLRALVNALEGLRSPEFEARLAGAGVFPLRGEPRVLWSGLENAEPWRALHDEVAERLDGLGIDLERRRYHPHLTLARLGRTSPARVREWIGQRIAYRSETFRVDRICLYSSILGRAGARYRIESVARLTPA